MDHADDEHADRPEAITPVYAVAPTGLAHAVLDAYGWPYDLNDDDILGRLLALNLERAAAMVAVDAR